MDEEIKRLAIDARMVEDAPLHGISRYTFELLKHIENPKKNYFVFIKKKSFLKNFPFKTPFTFIETHSKWLSLGEQIELPKLLKKYSIDLFHSPTFLVPLYCPCAFNITLHDVTHLVFWKDYSVFHKLYYEIVIRRQVKRAKKIFTVSNFSKDEILKYYGKSLGTKIQMIHNGLTSVPLTKEDLKNSKKNLCLPKKFVFALSNGKKHKNIKELIDVYESLETSVPLVIAGKIPKNINKSTLKKIIFIQSLKDKELFSAYKLCLFFVFPSIYEGFGLPPLEALSCGAKVISSNRASMPEVLGNRVLYFNPTDKSEFKSRLREELNNSKNIDINTVDLKNQFSWSFLGKCLSSL